MSLRVLFYGTPAVAVPYLEILAEREHVIGVVSQPDKPAGRGLETTASPVVQRALALMREGKVERIQRPNKSSEHIFEEVFPDEKRLREDLLPKTFAKGETVRRSGFAVDCDLAVVVAYGKLIKPVNLAIPKLGTLNVHFSLLPKYRGAAPVQWSLVRGEKTTGVTLFWLDEGMDTGPIFLQKEAEIGPDEDAPALMERLTRLGVEALNEVLDEIKAGRIVRKPQTGEASLAPLIKKDDARLDLTRPAANLHDLTRGMRIWPKAWLELKEQRLQILKTRLENEAGTGAPGTVVRVDRGAGILVQCGGSSRLWLLEVQPEGKKPVAAADFLNGLRLSAGDVLPLR